MTVPSSRRVMLGCVFALLTAAALADGQPVVVADHDDGYRYRLPYADGESFAVLQGFGAPLSHRGPEYYTIDFGMPEGTLVYSAREGTVTRVEDGFDHGCLEARCDRFANFVEIEHADGTLAKYFHLQRASALVGPGQRVGRGEPIARSGDTGFSNVPHLHFGVYRQTVDGKATSIPIQFAVRGGFVGELRTGARYSNRLQ